MANVTTIDVTTFLGNDKFPLKENDVYGLVETIASQNIRSAKSTNRIVDAFYDYEVSEGSVIEEAVVEMAKKQDFIRMGAPDFSPKDAEMHVKYFNNWETAQFETTTRKTDIKTIIANKGTGFEELVGEIIGSLTEGEGHEDYTKMRDIIANASVGVDCKSALFGGLVPSNAKGIIYCAREMYNALKATNSLGGVDYEYGVPVDDIRIAISESVLNLLDVTELANVFNLTKEELFGKLVVLPFDTEGDVSKLLVYDRKALGRGTRLYEYSQDIVGKGLYTNHYLTTDRCYFYNDLFKALSLDVSKAVTNAKSTLLTAEN